MSLKNTKSKIKEFWLKYEAKIILVVGLVLVAVISFEAGLLKGAKISQKPVIIEKTSQNLVQGDVAVQKAPEAQNSASSASNVQTGINTNKQVCAYIGSKNSNKYHLPTCRWAKQIKPENTVCFKDENDAKNRGYLPDKNCIK